MISMMKYWNKRLHNKTLSKKKNRLSITLLPQKMMIRKFEIIFVQNKNLLYLDIIWHFPNSKMGFFYSYNIHFSRLISD